MTTDSRPPAGADQSNLNHGTVPDAKDVNKADVTMIEADTALALIETERDFLLAKLKDSNSVIEKLPTLEQRLERVESDAREIPVLKQKLQLLENNLQELSAMKQQVVTAMAEEFRQFQEQLQQISQQLDSSHHSIEDLEGHSRASLRRPIWNVDPRPLLRILRQFPVTQAWALVKQHKLLSCSALFDRDWYLRTYPDVSEANCDPVLHYLLFGASEHRVPGPHFDGGRYLDANPDVRKAGINPLVHFLCHGVFEGRPLRRPSSTLEARSPSTDKQPAAEKTQEKTVRPIKAEPRFWYFIGDSLDWLRNHDQFTGVGRVSSQLYLASLGSETSQRVIPCVLGESSSKLVAARDSKDFEKFLYKIGVDSNSRFLNPPLSSHWTEESSPEPGDHVFFTGLVWTPTFTDLFKHLASTGIEFSVLIFDIIPIESPELVGEASQRSFSEWLSTTLSTATQIFTSSRLVKDQILRWALLSGLQVRAEIAVVSFGYEESPKVLSREDLAKDPSTAKVNLGDFVLCVGTIDKRKNQMFLCKLWKELAQAFDIDKLPQLVLVGRDDLHVIADNSEVSELIAANKILILEGLSDQHLAGLYKNCLFTAFPSLTEGYGLPVAESLRHGKLCLSSNLPVVREHAGDLAWYFSTSDLPGAVRLFTSAMNESDKRTAAEARIKSEFHPSSWTQTYELMIAEARRMLYAPQVCTSSGSHRPQYPGTEAVSAIPVFAKISKWCRGDDPEVSILIINWNSAPLTLECIRQVWSHTDGHTYEILVADNGSDPADLGKLRNLGSGIRLLEMGCNRYFGEANNIAVESAHGRYICLLNNDAFVKSGWLTALIRAMQEDPRIGAVGPLFLFPDGTVQEAGADVDQDGYPVRFGRGEKSVSAQMSAPRFVDYVSAATLLVPRDLFIEVGGFDLAYEPAYYEDPDLCMKIQATGRKVLYCPNAKVIHIEGHSANDNPVAEARRKALGDLNRGKFVSRWGEYLRSRDQKVLTSLRPKSLRCPAESSPVTEAPRTQTAAFYTPYALTPGGGESYVLAWAAYLADRSRVSIVTPRPYSQIRLCNLGEELGLDLSGLRSTIYEGFLKTDAPDLMVTMGNQILPDVEGRGHRNLYICQFPFRTENAPTHIQKQFLNSYEMIVVYSDYVRSHVFAALSAHGLPEKQVEVVYPPVQQIPGDSTEKKNIILSVGRFFVGGHCKRHDALIDAFKLMAPRFDQTIELHLAGSSYPEPEHMDYLTKLMASSEGFPIHFHVNPSSNELHQLYQDAAVYWHGTGIGADLVSAPEKAEHFGISLVEAMSAEAIPFSLRSGGPREIISHGETGFFFENLDDLAQLTLDLFTPTLIRRRQDIGRRAGRRARTFSRDKFRKRMTDLVDMLQKQEPSI